MDSHSAYKHSYKFERRTASLYVQNTGRQQCSPVHSWGPGVRNHYLIHHVISGRGIYILQNRRYELAAGDTFIIYPDTSIHYFADSRDPWEYIWVGFDGIDAPHYVEQTDFTREEPVLRGLYREEIQGLLEAIRSSRKIRLVQKSINDVNFAIEVYECLDDADAELIQQLRDAVAEHIVKKAF